MSRGGAETHTRTHTHTHTHTESKAGSRLWVVSMEPDMGLEFMNHEIRT